IALLHGLLHAVRLNRAHEREKLTQSSARALCCPGSRSRTSSATGGARLAASILLLIIRPATFVRIAVRSRDRSLLVGIVAVVIRRIVFVNHGGLPSGSRHDAAARVSSSAWRQHRRALPWTYGSGSGNTPRPSKPRYGAGSRTRRH